VANTDPSTSTPEVAVAGRKQASAFNGPNAGKSNRLASALHSSSEASKLIRYSLLLRLEDDAVPIFKTRSGSTSLENSLAEKQFVREADNRGNDPVFAIFGIFVLRKALETEKEAKRVNRKMGLMLTGFIRKQQYGTIEERDKEKCVRRVDGTHCQ
jgi:hypothetical protein